MAGTPWLRCLAPNAQARRRLICMAHAGGSGRLFAPWVRELGPEVELWIVELPGRGSRWREPLVERMSSLARGVSAALGAIGGATRSYAVFGHSMGALLGYALARRQEDLGLLPPDHLFLAAALPPHCRSRHMPLHGQSDSALLKHLDDLGGTPAEVLADPQMMALMLPVVRADLAACESYQISRPVSVGCPITVFAAEADRLAPPEFLTEWARYTQGEFAFHAFPGDHFFVYDSDGPVLKTIGARL